VRSYIKLVSGLSSIAFLLFASPPAAAIDLWEYHAGGDPSSGYPDENYKYLDRNEACVSGVVLPAPFACYTNARNVRAETYGNPNPTAAECLFDMTCTCGSCGVAPNYPNGGNTVIAYGGSGSLFAAAMAEDRTECRGADRLR